jgi:hypothetical protein
VTIEDSSEIMILCVTDQSFNDWVVYGDLRHRVERDYQAAMRGRWPMKKPVYRVVARRKH